MFYKTPLTFILAIALLVAVLPTQAQDQGGDKAEDHAHATTPSAGGGMPGMGPMGMMGMMRGGAGGGCPMMDGRMGGMGMMGMPTLPPGNEKLQLQMQAEMMQKMGETLAKYAARVRVPQKQ